MVRPLADIHVAIAHPSRTHGGQTAHRWEGDGSREHVQVRRVLGHAHVIRRPAPYDDVITLTKQRLIRYPSDTCRGATLVQQMSSYFDKCLLIEIQIILAR